MNPKHQFKGMLEQFGEKYPEKTDLVEKFIVLLESYDDNSAFVRDHFNDGHFVGSVLVSNPDRSKLLLMHHKKFGTWQQFGGHADGDIDILNVATRELEEEAGIGGNSVEILPEIFSIDIHEIGAFNTEPEHYHYDVTFLAKVEENVIFEKQESEVVDIEWFDVDQLHRDVHSGKFSSGLDNNLKYLG